MLNVANDQTHIRGKSARHVL